MLNHLRITISTASKTKERYIMKKNKIYSIFFCAGLFLGIFTGCENNITDINKAEKLADKKYTLNGKILISDAVPAEVSQLIKDNNGKARSAISSLNIDSIMTLEIYAQSEGSGNKIYQAEIQDKQYSIALPSSGKWNITATLLYPNSTSDTFTDVLNQQLEITIPEDESEFEISKDIVIHPKYVPNADGRLSLLIYDDTERVSKVIYYGEPADSAINPEGTNYFENQKEAVFAFTDSGNCAEISGTDIAAQVYNVTFKFLDEDNVLLYSCVEAISIYSGFTTDTWLGDGNHLVNTEDEVEFRITDELLSSYEHVNIPETVSDAPIVLWNGIINQKGNFERKLVIEGDEDYKYISAEDDMERSFSNGINVVGNIKNEMELGTPINKFAPQAYNSYNPVFCFDDQGPTNVYLLENERIKKLKSTYAGYVYDNNTDVDLNKLLSDKGIDLSNNYIQYSNTIAYYSGYLFFSFSIGEDYKIGIYELDTENLELLPLTFDENQYIADIKSLAVDKIEGSIKLCIAYKYRIEMDELEAIKILSATDMTTITTDTLDSKEIVIDNTAIGVSFATNKDMIVISDLYIWNNYLYIALCATPGNDSNIFSNSYYKSGDEYIRKDTFLSNGGIAKIDLSASSVSLETWKKHSTKVLGWYQNKYYDADGNEQGTVTMQPPLTSENKNYFYGPVKFIARKPDELVIADDGGYVDISYDGSQQVMGNCVNKNRVVTVNLLEESMSAKDVNVSFSATFEKATSYGIFRK